MSKDQVIGVGVLVASLLGLGVYFYLLFFSPWIILMVQLTAFVAVAAVLVILAWIGYTMATTPPPAPVGDLDLEEETKTGEEKKESSS